MKSNSVYGRYRRSHARGVAAVEFALLLPLLIILLGGMVDLGRIAYHHNMLNKMVRETGRYLSTQKAGDNVDVGLGANTTTSNSLAVGMVRGYLSQLTCPATGNCLNLVIEDAVYRTTYNCTASNCTQAGRVNITDTTPNSLKNISFTGGAFSMVRVTVGDYSMPTAMIGYVLGALGLTNILVPTVSSSFVQE